MENIKTGIKLEKLNIYGKIFEAKKEIGKISKDNTNPFFKSKYFDINSLLEHVEPILQKYNLLLLQPIKSGCVVTEIRDASSDCFVSSSMELPNIQDPQKLGSAITYYRRYTLQSLLGLQAEDDDANLASNNKKTSQAEKWLNDENVPKAIQYAKENNLKANDLRKFYKISKTNFAKLEKELG